MCGRNLTAVCGEAVVGLYRAGAEEEGYSLVTKGLESRDREELRVAIRTVGRTREARLEDRLYGILEGKDDPGIQAEALEALGAMGAAGRDDSIMPWLQNSSPEVRRSAVSSLALDREGAISQAIEILGDESPDVREAAIERISEVDKAAVPFLLKALTSPKKKLKEGVLGLFERFEVKDVAFSEFIMREIRQAYENIRTMESVRNLDETPALGVLIEHLEDKNDDAIFTVFRILEVQSEGTKMRTIYRGVKAGGRERANALEALEDSLHPTISRVLIPLVEETPPAEQLKIAQKHLGIDGMRPPDPLVVLAELLESEDPITQTCVLSVIGEQRMKGFSEKIESLRTHPDRTLQETAQQVLERLGTVEGVEGEKPMVSTMDKIIYLKKAYIFSDLQVRELAAIGSVATEKEHPSEEIIVKEGEPGDTMFLIISGEVSVVQNYGTEQEKVITTLAPGDYFGEMALFEDQPRSASIKTNGEARFLLLGRLEFEEIMREFPQIAINICRVFSKRVRETQRKFLS
jgi:hypothetical protein